MSGWKRPVLQQLRTVAIVRKDGDRRSGKQYSRAAIALEKRPQQRGEVELLVLMRFAASCDLFRGLPRFMVERLCHEMKLVELSQGEVLVKQGWPCTGPEDAVYVVLEGELTLRQYAGGGSTNAPGSGADSASPASPAHQGGGVPGFSFGFAPLSSTRSARPGPSAGSPALPSRGSRSSMLRRQASVRSMRDIALSFTGAASAAEVRNRRLREAVEGTLTPTRASEVEDIEERRQDRSQQSTPRSTGGRESPSLSSKHPSLARLVLRSESMPSGGGGAEGPGSARSGGGGSGDDGDPAAAPQIGRVSAGAVIGDEGIPHHRSLAGLVTLQRLPKARREAASSLRPATAKVSSAYAAVMAIPREVYARAVATAPRANGPGAAIPVDALREALGVGLMSAAPAAALSHHPVCRVAALPDRDRHLVFDALSLIDAVRTLPVAVQRALTEGACVQRLPSNRVLFAEGDPVDVDDACLCVVLSGELAAHVRRINVAADVPKGQEARGNISAPLDDGDDVSTVTGTSEEGEEEEEEQVVGFDPERDVAGWQPGGQQEQGGRRTLGGHRHQGARRAAKRRRDMLRAQARARAVEMNLYSAFDCAYGPVLCRVGRGDVFGQSNLHVDDPIVADFTLRTVSTVDVLCVSRGDVRAQLDAFRPTLSLEEGALADAVARAPEDRGEDDFAVILQLLLSPPLWTFTAQLMPHTRYSLARAAVRTQFRPGETLASVGEAVDGVWLVLAGQLVAVTTSNVDASDLGPASRVSSPLGAAGDEGEGGDTSPTPFTGRASGERTMRGSARAALLARRLGQRHRRRRAVVGASDGGSPRSGTADVTRRLSTITNASTTQPPRAFSARDQGDTSSPSRVGTRTPMLPGDVAGADEIVAGTVLRTAEIQAGPQGATALFIGVDALIEALGDALNDVPFYPATAAAVLRKPPTARSHRDIRLLSAWLSRSRFFSQFPMRTVRRVAARARAETVAARKPVVVEGTEGDRFYVVARGTCTVHVRGAQGRQHPAVTLAEDARRRGGGRALATSDRDDGFAAALEMAGSASAATARPSNGASRDGGGRQGRGGGGRRSSGGSPTGGPSPFGTYGVPTGSTLVRNAEVERRLGGCVATLAGGDSFGGRGLEVEGGQRSATVITRAPTLVVTLHRHDYLATVGRHRGVVFLPQVSLQVLEKAPPSRTPADLGVLMGLADNVSFLAQLPLTARKQACAAMRYRSLAQGHTLYEQGDEGDCMYIVLSGAVAVHSRGSVPGISQRLQRVASQGRLQSMDDQFGPRVALLQHGDAFGEEAVGAHEEGKEGEDEKDEEAQAARDARTVPRPASVLALLDVALLTLTRRDWRAVRAQLTRAPEFRPTLLEEQLRRHAVHSRWSTLVSGLIPSLGGLNKWHQVAAATQTDLTLSLMRSLHIFRRMDPAYRRRLAVSIRYITVRRGTVLYRRGDPAHFVYCVVSGAVSICRADASGGPGSRVATLGGQQMFGEVELALESGSRHCVAVAVADARLLRITSQHMESDWPPAALRSIRERVLFFRDRLGVFGRDLTPEAWQLLYYTFLPRRPRYGAVLAREGSPTATMYVVYSGAFRCLRAVPRPSTASGRLQEDAARGVRDAVLAEADGAGSKGSGQDRKPLPAAVTALQARVSTQRVAKHPAVQLAASPLVASPHAVPISVPAAAPGEPTGPFADLPGGSPVRPTTGGLPSPPGEAAAQRAVREGGDHGRRLRAHSARGTQEGEEEEGEGGHQAARGGLGAPELVVDEGASGREAWAGHAAAQVEVSTLTVGATFGELEVSPDTVVCSDSSSLVLAAPRVLLAKVLPRAMLRSSEVDAQHRSAWRAQRAWFLGRVLAGAAADAQAETDHLRRLRATGVEDGSVAWTTLSTSAPGKGGGTPQRAASPDFRILRVPTSPLQDRFAQTLSKAVTSLSRPPRPTPTPSSAATDSPSSPSTRSSAPGGQAKWEDDEDDEEEEEEGKVVEREGKRAPWPGAAGRTQAPAPAQRLGNVAALLPRRRREPAQQYHPSARRAVATVQRLSGGQLRTRRPHTAHGGPRQRRPAEEKEEEETVPRVSVPPVQQRGSGDDGGSSGGDTAGSEKEALSRHGDGGWSSNDAAPAVAVAGTRRDEGEERPLRQAAEGAGDGGEEEVKQHEASAPEGTEPEGEGGRPRSRPPSPPFVDGQRVEHGVVVVQRGSVANAAGSATALDPQQASGVLGGEWRARSSLDVALAMDATTGDAAAEGTPNPAPGVTRRAVESSEAKQERIRAQQEADAARSSVSVDRTSIISVTTQRQLQHQPDTAQRSELPPPADPGRHSGPVKRAPRPEEAHARAVEARRSDARRRRERTVGTRPLSSPPSSSARSGPEVVIPVVEELWSAYREQPDDQEPQGHASGGVERHGGVDSAALHAGARLQSLLRLHLRPGVVAGLALPTRGRVASEAAGGGASSPAGGSSHPTSRAEDVAGAVESAVASMSADEVIALLHASSPALAAAEAAAAKAEGDRARKALARVVASSLLPAQSGSESGGDPGPGQHPLRHARITVRRDESLEADEGGHLVVGGSNAPQRRARPRTAAAQGRGSRRRAHSARAGLTAAQRAVHLAVPAEMRVPQRQALGVAAPLGGGEEGETDPEVRIAAALQQGRERPVHRPGRSAAAAQARSPQQKQQQEQWEGEEIGRPPTGLLPPHARTALPERAVPLATHVPQGVAQVPDLPEEEEQRLGRPPSRVAARIRGEVARAQRMRARALRRKEQEKAHRGSALQALSEEVRKAAVPAPRPRRGHEPRYEEIIATSSFRTAQPQARPYRPVSSFAGAPSPFDEAPHWEGEQRSASRWSSPLAKGGGAGLVATVRPPSPSPVAPRRGPAQTLTLPPPSADTAPGSATSRPRRAAPKGVGGGSGTVRPRTAGGRTGRRGRTKPLAVQGRRAPMPGRG